MEGASDTYQCPICKEIFVKAIRLSPCSHELCEDCSAHLPQNCPICRKEIQKEATIKIDRTERLSTEKTKCVCEQVMTILEYKDHVDNCEHVKAANEKAKSNLLDKSKMKPTVNRATFICPVCKQAHLDRATLVNHIISLHPQSKGVCPICAAQPWGDPNYVTGLAKHMNLRHKFDYDTYTDYEKEDDEILQQVLRDSAATEDEMLRLALELSKTKY